MSHPILGATESSERNVDALQLLDTYRAGLRRAVQDAHRVSDQDGWAGLEILWRFFQGWFSSSDWFVVWALMTAAEASPVGGNESMKATVEGQQEERSLLDRLARATRVADPTSLGVLLRVIIYGSGTTAALDDGRAAAETLRLMLARAWQEHSARPLAPP
jgi:hypothetical protein